MPLDNGPLAFRQPAHRLDRPAHLPFGVDPFLHPAEVVVVHQPPAGDPAVRPVLAGRFAVMSGHDVPRDAVQPGDLAAPARPVVVRRVEGRQEYTQLLYVPAHAPFDLWDREHRHGVKLYVRVLPLPDTDQPLPNDPAVGNV